MNRQELLDSKICILPYMHLATHPDGFVTLCCESLKFMGQDRARNGSEHINLNTHSPDQVLTSEFYRTIRKQMEMGMEPAVCSKCYRLEREGVSSKRTHEIDEFFKRHEVFDKKLEFEFIELRLGNVCNLRCISCNPISSSGMRNVFREMRDLEFVDTSLIDARVDASWTESTQFWDQLFDCTTAVRKIYINGGEPTLIKAHWRFLQRLAETGRAGDIELMYNTNMTAMNDDWFDVWRHFKKVIIGCSIDDLGERNEYIRVGSNWEQTLANLVKASSYRSGNVQVYITMTVSALNVLYVDEFIEFFDQLGVHVNLNFVSDPPFLNPAILPDHIKTAALQQKAAPEIAPRLHGHEGLDNFLRYLDRTDKITGKNWRAVFPKLANYL